MDEPVTSVPAARPDTPRRALLALALLVPAPSIGTAMYMLIPGIEGTAMGRGAFFAAKVWLVLLPAFWWLRIDRGRPGLSPPRRGGFGVAIALGAVIGAIVYGAYALLGRHWIDPSLVIEQSAETGIDKPLTYLLAATYFCTVNAILEEYVWRWFVFRKCETLLGGRGVAAVLLSAALFTVHHVLALRAQFDWNVTILGSLGVFVGGAVWSWCYLRYRSIWPGWISHVIVDVVIFAIGWRIIFGTVGAG